VDLHAIHNLTVATYNVHSSVGRDRACDPDRILAVLDEIQPDLMALQEVGHRRIDGPRGDQFAYFEARAGMHAVPGLNLLFGRRPFGNILLSRWPVLAVRRIDLSVEGREPRGAIDAEFDVAGQKLRVIATHLGLWPGERRRQIERLRHALAHEPYMPTIIMGDFNVYGRGRRGLQQLGAPAGGKDAPASFPARFPLLGLDRIWTRPNALLLSVRAHRSPLACAASDHLPVVARIGLRHAHAIEAADEKPAIAERRAVG
jgi:endonuclease/exonuclease/phosphatase family metal-dependent hydrolase